MAKARNHVPASAEALASSAAMLVLLFGFAWAPAACGPKPAAAPTVKVYFVRGSDYGLGLAGVVDPAGGDVTAEWSADEQSWQPLDTDSDGSFNESGISVPRTQEVIWVRAVRQSNGQASRSYTYAVDWEPERAPESQPPPTPKPKPMPKPKSAQIPRPASYRVVKVTPAPDPSQDRSRFQLEIEIPVTVKNPDVIAATVMDLLRKRGGGVANRVLVYGQGASTAPVPDLLYKATGEWAEDGLGWSGDEPREYRLKLAFATGAERFYDFSR